VHWDQPGSGKSFASAGNRLDPSLTLDAIVDDGIAVAEFVSRRLGQRKVVLLGNSWGSLIAVKMIRKRPDLFAAYVGTAQGVNKPEDERIAYEQVLAKARGRNDVTAMEELQKAGAPPYASLQEFRVQRKWASAYENLPPLDVPALAGSTPGSSMADLQPWVGGLVASEQHFRGNDLRGPAATTDLRDGGRRFKVPMFFIHGREDDIAPLSQVTGFVAWLRAPRKKLVVIDGAGHNAILSRPAEFLDALDALVTPLVRGTR
jgi:pimeloyl-ACP methyl ester carboxylesterase